MDKQKVPTPEEVREIRVRVDDAPSRLARGSGHIAECLKSGYRWKDSEEFHLSYSPEDARALLALVDAWAGEAAPMLDAWESGDSIDSGVFNRALDLCVRLAAYAPREPKSD